MLGAVVLAMAAVVAAGAIIVKTRDVADPDAHPQQVDSWTPLPDGQSFQPRTDGYYWALAYSYFPDLRGDDYPARRGGEPDTLTTLRFFDSGLFCMRSFHDPRHRPSDATIMAELDRQASHHYVCSTWDSDGYHYTAPAGDVESIVVGIRDDGFTVVEPVLIEGISIQRDYMFVSVG